MLVSVIMPAYNAEQFIAQSIQSVLYQTYAELELLIIDDASVDRTVEIANEYAHLDDRVKVLKNDTNRGVAFSRNRGIDLSKGSLIAFLDSDDIWLPDKLSVQVELKSKYPSIPLFYSGYELIDPSGNRLKKAVLPPLEISYQQLLRTNDIGCLTVMIDRQMLGSNRFKKVGHEDYNLWLSVLKDGNNALGSTEVLAQYRIHNSLSSNKKKAAIWRWKVYRSEQKMNFIQTCYYFFHYAINSFNKYTTLEY
jgi:glycosyltransferase involved in cell wall biosynthesis